MIVVTTRIDNLIIVCKHFDDNSIIVCKHFDAFGAISMIAEWTSSDDTTGLKCGNAGHMEDISLQ